MKKLTLLVMILSLFFMFSCASDDDDDNPSTDGDSLVVSDSDTVSQDEDSVTDEEPQIDEDSVNKDEEPQPDEDAVKEDSDPEVDEDGTVQDEEPQIDEDSATPDEDEITDVDVDTEEPIETFTPGTYTRTYKVRTPKDAVCSHLLDVYEHAWNYRPLGVVAFGFTSMLDGTDNVVAEHAALRFDRISIPENAVIDSVKMFIYPHNEVDSSNKVYMMFGFEDSANSAAFDPSNYDSGRPDQRNFASAQISEYLIKCDSDCRPDWMGEAYCEERTNDCWDRNTPYQLRDKNSVFKTALQSIVSKDGWQAGNAITFLSSGMYPSKMDPEEEKAYSESRLVMGYSEDSTDKVPYIEITFTVQ